MNLVDSSAWIDYIRNRPTRATDEVQRLIDDSGEQILMCEVVAMELLAGAVSEQDHLAMLRLVDGLHELPVDVRQDYRTASQIYRNARRAGLTIRRMNECLIAAVALRYDATVVHKDADFEAIADVAPLSTIDCR